VAAATASPERRSTIDTVYLCLLLYVSAIYIRPGELIGSGPAIPFVEILSFIAVVVAMLAYLRETRPWISVPHDGFILGFWLAIVVSNLAWGWMGGALKGFVEFFKIAFYYFLMRFAVREPRQLRGLLVLLIGLNLFHAAFGILQFHTGRGLGNLELHKDGRIRSLGIFNDPNDLALALVMVVPLLLTGIADREIPRGRRLLGLTALVPILLAVEYTTSRGALVGLAIIVVIFSLQRFGLVRGAPVACLGLVVLLVTWVPGRALDAEPGEGSPQLLATSPDDALPGRDPLWPEDSSNRGRIEAWSEGLSMLTSHPLFGVGYSRFTDYNELVAHNSFIHTFAELGLLGAFFLVGMVYWYFKGLRADAGGASGARWARALTLSGIAFFTMVSFLSRQYDLVFYTLLGLGASHAAIVQGEDPDGRLVMTRRDLRNIVLLTAGGIVITKLVVRVLTMWTRG
jgi:putative inorganic carbon (HCO3(-)) transporter